MILWKFLFFVVENLGIMENIQMCNDIMNTFDKETTDYIPYPFARQ